MRPALLHLRYSILLQGTYEKNLLGKWENSPTHTVQVALKTLTDEAGQVIMADCAIQ